MSPETAAAALAGATTESSHSSKSNLASDNCQVNNSVRENFEVACNANGHGRDDWRSTAFSSDALLVEAIQTLSLEHWNDDAKPLRARIDATLPQAEQGRLGIFCARALYRPHGRIELDTAGTWSIVLLAHPERCLEVEDIVAFDPDARRAGSMLGQAMALGLDEIFEARLHPQHRTYVYSDVLSWLRNRGRGVLPLSWSKTALLLKERGIAGVIADNVADAKLIEGKFRQALAAPPVFVKQERAAA